MRATPNAFQRISGQRESLFIACSRQMNRADRVEPVYENANFIRGCDHPAVKIGSLETKSAAYRLCAAKCRRPAP